MVGLRLPGSRFARSLHVAGQGRLATHPSFHFPAPRLPCGVLGRHQPGAGHRGGGALFHPHVRDHRLLPPLLFAPLLQDLPRLPALPRHRGKYLDAAWIALVGRHPPPSPQALRRGGGHPLAPHQRLPLVPHRLAHLEAEFPHQLQGHPRPREIPRARFPEPLRSARPHRLRHCHARHRLGAGNLRPFPWHHNVAILRMDVLHLHHRPAPRHPVHQLPRPRLGKTKIRYRG